MAITSKGVSHDCPTCVKEHKDHGTVYKQFTSAGSTLVRSFQWSCTVCDRTYGWDCMVPMTGQSCRDCGYAPSFHKEPVFEGRT
jgi:hypothetical protein